MDIHVKLSHRGVAIRECLLDHGSGRVVSLGICHAPIIDLRSRRANTNRDLFDRTCAGFDV
jgi:hypothetical protein